MANIPVHAGRHMRPRIPILQGPRLPKHDGAIVGNRFLRLLRGAAQSMTRSEYARFLCSTAQKWCSNTKIPLVHFAHRAGVSRHGIGPCPLAVPGEWCRLKSFLQIELCCEAIRPHNFKVAAEQLLPPSPSYDRMRPREMKSKSQNIKYC